LLVHTSHTYAHVHFSGSFRGFSGLVIFPLNSLEGTLTQWHYGQSIGLTTLGKLFTPVCLITKQYNLVPAKEQWCFLAGKVTAVW